MCGSHSKHQTSRQPILLRNSLPDGNGRGVDVSCHDRSCDPDFPVQIRPTSCWRRSGDQLFGRPKVPVQTCRTSRGHCMTGKLLILNGTSEYAGNSESNNVRELHMDLPSDFNPEQLDSSFPCAPRVPLISGGVSMAREVA